MYVDSSAAVTKHIKLNRFSITMIIKHIKVSESGEMQNEVREGHRMLIFTSYEL